MRYETTVTGVFSVELATEDVAIANRQLFAVACAAMAPADTWEMTRPVQAATGEGLAVRKMIRDNIRTWVESMAVDTGTTDQKQRWLDGRLPRAELEGLARAELFRAFDSVPRWTRIRSTDLEHEPTCLKRVLDAKIEYGDGEGGARLKHPEVERINLINAGLAQLKAHPWLMGIDEIMGGLRWHRVTCTRCKATKHAHSYSVTVPWLDRVLSREYAL